MSERTITIGRKFYDDHRLRDCGETGIVLRATKTTVTVQLDEEAWDDLYSDAKFYAWMYRDGEWAGDPELQGIGRAAERTLAKMRAVSA
jgi:hypothetical protein